MLTNSPKTVVAVKTPKPTLDLYKLQQQQLSGEEIEQATGSQDSEYRFPKHESSYIHVRLTKKVNDPIRKQYTEETSVKKYAPVQFDRMNKNNYFDTQTYDKVEVLHDPRSAAVIAQVEEQAAQGNQPWEPVPGLPSLQDAQLRYQQLYGTKAPAVSYQALLEFILAKEEEGGPEDALLGEGETGTGETGTGETGTGETGTTVQRKVVRSTVEAQDRFRELFNDDPADRSFTELKALIESEEKRLDELGNATK